MRPKFYNFAKTIVHALLILTKNWESEINKWKQIGTVMIGLSRVFDNFDLVFFITKSKAYVLESSAEPLKQVPALKVLYLENEK